jgi:hypothetical protein
MMERVAILETKVSAIDGTVKELVKDIKLLQNRWAIIMGGLIVLSNLPTILSIIRNS